MRLRAITKIKHKIGDNILLYRGDCLVEMDKIPDGSVDMVLCDLPYGTTACKWDTIIPLEPLWEQYTRIIKNDGAIVLTASQPFTSTLVMSNPKLFRHEWIYQKRCASNFAQAKYAPMKEHESVLVFAKSKPQYFPIKEERKGSGAERAKHPYSLASRHKSGDFVGNIKGDVDLLNDAGNSELRYPSSVQEFNNRASGDRGFHPTQKPVALMEYLIKTYTLPGQVVLDNCMGSGSTGVACINTNRKFIGIELDEKYYNISKKRIEEALHYSVLTK